MLQATAALLGASATLAACYAAGAILLDRIHAPLTRSERIPLATIVGAACLHLAIFAVLVLRIGYRSVVIAILAALIAAALGLKSWNLRAKEEPPLPRFLAPLSIALFGVFTLLYFCHALAPESSPDGSSYHLGLVAGYLRAHRFPFDPTFYAALSGGLEMLFVPAFAIGRHSAAALVHFGFTVALAWSLFAFGRRMGAPWVGAAAALLTYASPIVGIDGTSAYNDVGLAAVVFGAFYFLEIWDTARNRLLLIPVGLLCGYAYAIKYTAFIIVPFAAGFVIWKSRRWRLLIPLAAGSLLMAAPWALKNWITLQDPVAPFGNNIFPNPYFNPLIEHTLLRDSRSMGVTDKWALPLEVTIRGTKTVGILGPVFLLFPLGLFALRRREGRALLAALALLLPAYYFTNLGTRFLIPALPFLALAIAIPLRRYPPLLALVMVFHAVSSWPAVIKTYTSGGWRLDRIDYKQALRLIPQDVYLRQNFPPYGAARLIDRYVPADEPVMTFGGIPEAYTSRKILVSWHGHLTLDLADAIFMGWKEADQPRLRQIFSFPERTVSRIRLVQTSATDAAEQWSVHELRFYDRGAELPREPGWRLRAHPNPWDVQLAFDNSQATRWRTWRAPQPGDDLDVDFGRARPLDQVVVETSYESLAATLQLQEMDASGRWIAFGGAPVNRSAKPRLNLRRAATYELVAHGIHYLALQRTDFGFADIQADPAGWGLAPVASGYGIALYRVLP